jgi:hypothetical protein
MLCHHFQEVVMKGHVRLFSILLSLALLLGAVGCTPTPSDPTEVPDTPDQDEQPSPETPPQEIDISSLPDGVYILRSLNKKGITHRLGQFIIRR